MVKRVSLSCLFAYLLNSILCFAVFPAKTLENIPVYFYTESLNFEALREFDPEIVIGLILFNNLTWIMR